MKKLSIEKFKHILRQQKMIAGQEVQMESLLFNEVGITSLEIMELILILENEYKIEIPSDELQFEETMTVEEFLFFINRFIN